MEEGLVNGGSRSTARSLVAWVVPLLAGVVVTVGAATLGNPLIPIGTAEVFAAFALGAGLRSAPFRIGLLLVAPAAVYLLLIRSEPLPSPVWTVVLFAGFALFNGLFAGAGAQWATDISSRRRGRAEGRS